MERSLYLEHAALERDHWWFVGRPAILELTIRHWCSTDPSTRILDVGCGTGGMSPMLAQFGAVQGIEADPASVAHCRRTYPELDVRHGVIPADVPTDGTFDLVTAFDVIEHIDDDVGAVVALREAAKPNGGTVLVTVPALKSLWSDHDVVNGHYRRYTRRTLATTLVTAGLEIRHISYFNTIPLPVVAGIRIDAASPGAGHGAEIGLLNAVPVGQPPPRRSVPGGTSLGSPHRLAGGGVARRGHPSDVTKRRVVPRPGTSASIAVTGPR